MHATLTWLHFNTTVLSTDNRPGTELGKFVAVLASLGGHHPHASDLEGGLLSVGLCGCEMNHVATNTSETALINLISFHD